MHPLLITYLKYPEKIFAREKEGVIAVSKYTKNVEEHHDIVLQNKNYLLSNIYVVNMIFKNIIIEPNSVGIISNLRVIERSKLNNIYSIYVKLIDNLIAAKKNVYILRHSYEDLAVCEKIKSYFSDNPTVKLISDDLNALEFEGVVKQFDFVVASRYHSIIHAYKNGVPALVIGWATKYYELLKSFDQLDYFFDIRQNIDINPISNKLNKLLLNFDSEKIKISDKMTQIQKNEQIFNFMNLTRIYYK